MAIVLLQRQKRLASQHRELLEDRQRTLDELEAVGQRLAELEERADFAERLLGRAPDPAPSSAPPSAEGRT